MSSPSTIPNARSILFRLWPWLAAFGSGLLLTLCFPPFDLGWLVWVALSPLLCAVWLPEDSRRSHKRPFLLGYVAGIVFFSLVFCWLSSLGTIFKNGALFGLPVLLSLLFGLYFGAWAWFVARLPGSVRGATMPGAGAAANPLFSSRRNLQIGCLAACAWVVQEWVRGWLFSGFGWNGLGVALHGNLAMIQTADLAGVLGLSWLIAFCNVMAVLIVRRIVAEIGPQFLKRTRWEFSATLALVAGVFAYGVRPLARPAPAGGIELKVAMLQPNVAETDKWDPDMEDSRLEELDALTKKAAEAKPDLIVWPEAATPRGIFADTHNQDFVLQAMKYGNYGLLVGTIRTDISMNGSYNSAVLLTPSGTGLPNLQIYDKMHLVPYGEYLPMRPLLEPIAGNLVPGDFLHGKSPHVFALSSPPVHLAPLICFEDTLGDLTRRFVGNGAEVLLNLTNDGWFLETAGSAQHFANSIFRAVENRRPLLRCTNTGITGSVDSAGRVTLWAPPFQKAGDKHPLARTISIPSHPPLTFYTRWGDWIAFLSSGIVLWKLGSAALARRIKETPGTTPVTIP